MYGWGALCTSSSTFLEKGGRRDNATIAVQMELQSAAGAADLLSLLPQFVAWVAFVFTFKGAVQAWSTDVVLECLLIDPLVDTGSALCALKVAGGLFKVMLVRGRVLVGLVIQQVPDDLRPGEFFGWP